VSDVPSSRGARVAGALYRGTIIFGLFAEVGARGSLIVGGDAAFGARRSIRKAPVS